MSAPTQLGKRKVSKSDPVPMEEQMEQETSGVSIPLEEQIRLRAYEIYQIGQKNGGQDRSELGDWLQAEAEILGSQEK